MNLIIDVGNSLVKLGVFHEGKLQTKKTSIKKDFLFSLSEISEAYPSIKQCIVSAVANLSEHQLSKLQEKYPVSVLNHETKVPFQNSYATPKTLGMDRIALVSAAASQYPDKNVLVIDAGTCITYDFLNSKNHYLGGAISPGLEMRYKSLHTFTDKLPLLDASVPKEITGNSTALSIHSGIVNGMVYEIDGFCSTYQAEYNDLTIILTGGDLHFLRDSLKSNIFANSNFLLEGLNFILEYNKH